MIKRFVGLFTSVVLILLLFLPATMSSSFSWNELLESRPLVFYSSSEQLKDFSFQLASYNARVSQNDNPVIVFGSSELAPKEGNAFYPAQFWTNRNYGMDIFSSGRAYVTSLWDAIELGAFDASTNLQNNKVVVIPSFTWFLNATKYDNGKKQAVYSASAFESFLANPKISDNLKQSVRSRLVDYGILDSSESSVSKATNYIDSMTSGFVSDMRLKIRASTEPTVLEKRNFSDEGSHPQPFPETRFGELLSPDWQKIQQDARSRTAKKSTNDYGFQDSWYEKDFQKWLSSTEKWKIDRDNAFNANELEEFEWFLQVCKECGIDVLVVLAPVSSTAWDLTQVDTSIRNEWYQAISAASLESGAHLADLTDFENDKYFCRDYNHPSEYGWSLINEAIYDFYYLGK